MADALLQQRDTGLYLIELQVFIGLVGEAAQRKRLYETAQRVYQHGGW